MKKKILHILGIASMVYIVWCVSDFIKESLSTEYTVIQD